MAAKRAVLPARPGPPNARPASHSNPARPTGRVLRWPMSGRSPLALSTGIGFIAFILIHCIRLPSFWEPGAAASPSGAAIVLRQECLCRCAAGERAAGRPMGRSNIGHRRCRNDVVLLSIAAIERWLERRKPKCPGLPIDLDIVCGAWNLSMLGEGTTRVDRWRARHRYARWKPSLDEMAHQAGEKPLPRLEREIVQRSRGGVPGYLEGLLERYGADIGHRLHPVEGGPEASGAFQDSVRGYIESSETGQWSVVQIECSTAMRLRQQLIGQHT